MKKVKQAGELRLGEDGPTLKEALGGLLKVDRKEVDKQMPRRKKKAAKKK